MDVAEKPNQYQGLTTGTDNKKRHMERPTFEMLVEEFTKKGAPDPRQIAQDFQTITKATDGKWAETQ